VRIEDLSDEQLDNMEANYRSKNKTEGGKYSLSEVLLEKKRRRPTAFGVREVAAKIIELTKASDDGFVSYGEIWTAFRPSIPWEGHKNLRIVADALGRVLHHCVKNRLPILTVLVVQSANRKLSSKAIQNIYNECRDLGLDVGLDPTAFIENEVEAARALVIDQLPDDL
jgi:hypothetical protein